LVPPFGEFEDPLTNPVQAFFVGAESLEPELADPGTYQRAPMQESSGVQLRTERDERRFGDDRLIEVEKGRAHAFMLGPDVVHFASVLADKGGGAVLRGVNARHQHDVVLFKEVHR
jgi:hypothetical protein